MTVADDSADSRLMPPAGPEDLWEMPRPDAGADPRPQGASPAGGSAAASADPLGR